MLLETNIQSCETTFICVIGDNIQSCETTFRTKIILSATNWDYFSHNMDLGVLNETVKKK